MKTKRISGVIIAGHPAHLAEPTRRFLTACAGACPQRDMPIRADTAVLGPIPESYLYNNKCVGTSSACIPNEYIRGIPSSGKYQQRLEVDV